MTDSYKLYIRARISRAKFRQILRLFALDLTASQTAELTNLNRNTVNRYLTLVRSLIANFCELESPFPARSNLMNLTSARAIEKASVVAERKTNTSFLVSTNVTGVSIPRLSKTSKPRLYSELSKAK